MITKWDICGIQMARLAASWSKDPSTKVGAAIFRPDLTVASIGFNGFPRGIADDHRLDDRETKYELIIHAEMNAILSAREPLKGYTLYCSLFTCARCAVHVIQAGISRVVAPELNNERWKNSIDHAASLYAEADVETVFVHERLISGFEQK